MNNLKLPALILVVLIVVASVFYLNNSKTTLSKSYTDFAIEDTSKITKIFLADKGTTSLFVEKKNNQWFLNGTQPARIELVNLVLQALKNMTVRSTVPDAMKPTVIADMSGAYQRYIEVYAGDQLLKAFFMGTPSPDEIGTYMMIKGSDEPFEVYLPGFKGYLRPRFSIVTKEWVSSMIINYPYTQIKSIKAQFLSQPTSSFTINYPTPKQAQLLDYQQQEVKNFNQYNALKYASTWGGLGYEAPLEPDFKERDSLLTKGQPAQIFTLTNTKNEITSLKCYLRYSPKVELRKDKEEVYDHFNFFGLINDKEWVLMQYYNANAVIQPIGFFINTTAK